MKNFDYYYSNPAQNYYFNFRTLFSDDFKGLSVNAKALYALMIERSNLSNHNNWFDQEKKVYIIYTAAQVMDDFQCSERTALKLLAELATFGLIERFQNRKGQAYIIYVKLYNHTKVISCDAQPDKAPEMSEKEKEIPQKPKQEQKKEQLQRPVRPLRAEFAELSDYTKAINAYWAAEEKFEKAQKEIEEKEIEEKEIEKEVPSDTSVSPANYAVDTCKNCSCHLQKMQSSSINSSNIHFSIYPSYHNLSKKDVMDKEQINKARNFIKQNIDYDTLLDPSFKIQQNALDEIVEIITQVMTSTKETIRIAGEERPTEVVKNVYAKLNMMDIQYVYDCISKTSTKIANIIAYTRTALYHAKYTSSLYYSNLVHYDWGH